MGGGSLAQEELVSFHGTDDLSPHDFAPESDHVGTQSTFPLDENTSVVVNHALAHKKICATMAAGENRMLIPVLVSGKAIPALIDSGAATSFICKQAVNQLGLAYVDSSKEIYGFGDKNKINIVGRLELEGKIRGLDISPILCDVMVPGQNEVPLILGVDFLIQNRLLINISKGKLSQKSAEGHIVDLYVNNDMAVHRRMIPCRVKENMTVKSGEVGKLEVCVDLPSNSDIQTYLFEPVPRRSSSAPFSGICEISENMSVLVHCTSSQSTKFILGEVVGYLKSVQVVDCEQKVSKTSQLEHSPLDLCAVALGEHLSPEQKQKVLELLRGKVQVLSKGDHDVGILNAREHKIELLSDVPIYQKPRRLPEPVADEIESQCRELQLLDVIEPSRSPYSSPVVPIRKKDGTLRLCVDYRRLNAVTKPDRFPLPNLNDSIYSLHSKRYFTSLDLVRGYYQLPLDEKSRECTAFSTPHNHWQFKRLSIGLRNAQSAFQREI